MRRTILANKLIFFAALFGIFIVYYSFVEVLGEGAYDPCVAFDGKKISLYDFQGILLNMFNGKCESKITVELGFSMSSEDVINLAYNLDIAQKGKLVFFTENATPKGIGALFLIDLENNTLKRGDVVQIWAEGTPERDVFVKLLREGCDPLDENCEMACAYADFCDFKCYVNMSSEGVCNRKCVDINGDGKINIEDLDGICDLDCYNNVSDGVYDIDCVWFNRYAEDGICDPDSASIPDGVCDPDCGKIGNYICDPDCNGTVYEGNPSGLNDTDCFVCDNKCNGYCSPACTPKDNDPDCPGGYEQFLKEGLKECCGNGKCGLTENCKNCPSDCACSQGVCCPEDPLADYRGCSLIFNVGEGGTCYCDNQCQENMTCSVNHCCKIGTFWNGTTCVNRTDVLIVSIKSKLKAKYGDSGVDMLENKINEFISALNRDGLGAMFLYLDEDETANICPGGCKVNDPSDWAEIDSVLDLLHQKLNFSYLIIIGGDDIIPQAPIGSWTGSDDPYGDVDRDGNYIPDVSVGRIPDPKGGDLDVILAALNTAIHLHLSGGLSLRTYIAPIMGCGGFDNRPWNSRCFCSYIFGSSCLACGSCCGCISPDNLSGKDFAMIDAHGPGPSSIDFLLGGCIYGLVPSDIISYELKDAVWMSMACGGGHLKLKRSTSNSFVMTFLKNGGAIFIGSTNDNYGDTSGSGCPLPGGHGCVGTLYALVAREFGPGVRIGDAYLRGKRAYALGGYYCDCPGGAFYQRTINCLYGDPTIKIKEVGW